MTPKLDHSAASGKMVSDHIAASGKVILTTEQAQQIEEALDELRYANNTDIAKTKYYKALSTIRAARAQEQEPVACPHGVDDGACKECYMEQAEQSQLADATLEPVAWVKGDDVILASRWPAVSAPDGYAPLVYAAHMNTAIPAAYMFKVKRTLPSSTTLDVFAAIEYHPLPHEDIISKEPLYAAPVQQAEQEPVADVFEAKKTAFADCKQKVKAPDDVWTVSDGINFFGFFSHGWEYAKKYYTAPQPDINLNCPSVQKRLATSWGYVKAGPAAADHLAASGKPIAEQTNTQFMEGYRIGLAEMREKCAKVVTEHAPTCSPHWVSYVVAIRAIKFEGDTGFRPVSEMVAEHKQDPKKAAAIEKAKMRKEEQEPVAWMWACTECGTEAEDGTDGRICSSCGYHKFYKAPKDAAYVCEARAQEQSEQEPVAVVGFDTQSWRNLVDALTKLPDGTKLYAEPANKTEEKPLLVQAWEKRFAKQAEQEPVKLEHKTDGSPCWCNPELNYKDPKTGAEVWVHKEPQ